MTFAHLVLGCAGLATLAVFYFIVRTWHPLCREAYLPAHEVRYACLDCAKVGADFDLCARCEDDESVRMNHADGKHVFAKLRRRRQFPWTVDI